MKTQPIEWLVVLVFSILCFALVAATTPSQHPPAPLHHTPGDFYYPNN